MMARAASFHADQTWRKLAEEGHHLRSPERAPDENLARAVDGVHLEDILGQVDADGRDLHRSGSNLLLRDSTILAPQRREREPSTPSAFGVQISEADPNCTPWGRFAVIMRAPLGPLPLNNRFDARQTSFEQVPRLQGLDELLTCPTELPGGRPGCYTGAMSPSG